MTNDEKREQARILLSCKSSEHATHKDADIDAALKAGAAALLREAEAATAPDVSDKELITLLHEAYSMRDTMLDRHLIEDELPRLITALRAARKREGELTQALADATADWDHMTEIASQRLAHETRMRIERDTLRAENATLRAELAEAKADLEKLFAYDGTYCAAVLSGEVDDED